MKVTVVENGISIYPETDFEEKYLIDKFLLNENRKVILKGAPTCVTAMEITATGGMKSIED